jgi:hypothetical protein
MATLGGYILNRHRSQYDDGNSVITHHEGCTWTTGANGADASTGGRVDKTPDQIHTLVSNDEETNPTPGWSLPDLKKAMDRLGIPFEDKSGTGWAAAISALMASQYVSLQGDSDRFPDGCSGEFDGDHDLGIFPVWRTFNGLRQWWINDPICPTGRWEYEYILRNYAVKFYPTVRFGVFTHSVPRAVTPTRFRVVITGRTRLYSKVRGTYVGTVTKATYICTKVKASDGLWWYRIVEGKRTGQAFKINRYTKATKI